MIKVSAKKFDEMTLPKSQYGDLVDLDDNVYPFDGFQNRNWNKITFDEQLEKDLIDGFLPCNYLFFYEDDTLIGIIKGNFAGETVGVELIQVSKHDIGYGTKIINSLSDLGIHFIIGYSTDEAKSWWEKMGVEFTGKLMFNEYALFTKEL